MLAAMSMQWTVARAVVTGLVIEHLPFVRTAKGGKSKKRLAFPAFYEAVMGGLLVLGAVILFRRNYEDVREINLFGAVLIVQSLPFLAAAALAVVEGTRLNDFAFWKDAQTRLLAPLAVLTVLLPRRPAVIQQPAPQAETRNESA